MRVSAPLRVSDVTFAETPSIDCVVHASNCSSVPTFLTGVQSETMYQESLLPSPEDVACYEECVTDETILPSSPSSHITSVSTSKSIPKSSSSGRITKKGSFARLVRGPAVIVVFFPAGKSRSKQTKDRKCSSPVVLRW